MATKQEVARCFLYIDKKEKALLSKSMVENLLKIVNLFSQMRFDGKVLFYENEIPIPSIPPFEYDPLNFFTKQEMECIQKVYDLFTSQE